MLKLDQAVKLDTVCEEAVFEKLLPEFLLYAQYERNLRPETLAKYKQMLARVFKDLGGILDPQRITLGDITILKMKMRDRGAGSCGINGALDALRTFLNFCCAAKKLNVIDPREIKRMPIPRKPVNYLTEEELQKFLSSISTSGKRGLRMRTLTEVLLSTGARISEALSLKIFDIDFPRGEATIIGKGGKERPIYFNDRSLYWIKEWMKIRKDNNPYIFVTFGSNPKQLNRTDLWRSFRHYAELAGIKKKVTPHVFRHSFATLFLKKSNNLFYVKELLGRSDISVTARHYLGADKEAIKAAHTKYLKLD